MAASLLPLLPLLVCVEAAHTLDLLCDNLPALCAGGSEMERLKALTAAPPSSRRGDEVARFFPSLDPVLASALAAAVQSGKLFGRQLFDRRRTDNFGYAAVLFHSTAELDLMLTAATSPVTSASAPAAPTTPASSHTYYLAAVRATYRDELRSARDLYRETLRADPAHAAAAHNLQVVEAALSSRRFIARHRALVGLVALDSQDPAVMLEMAVQGARPTGLALEFGVWRGQSTRRIARLLRPSGRKLHAFDSFAGLPEDWKHTAASVHERGYFALSLEEQPLVTETLPPNVELHVGYFNETLPEFAATAATNPRPPERRSTISFIHVDCDLHSSSVTALERRGCPPRAATSPPVDRPRR